MHRLAVGQTDCHQLGRPRTEPCRIDEHCPPVEQHERNPCRMTGLRRSFGAAAPAQQPAKPP